MSQEWFYTKDGKSRTGPVSAADLHALAKSGQLASTDMVWKQGMPQWTAASAIKGLFINPTSLEAVPNSPAKVPRTTLEPAPEVVAQVISDGSSKPALQPLEHVNLTAENIRRLGLGAAVSLSLLAALLAVARIGGEFLTPIIAGLAILASFVAVAVAFSARETWTHLGSAGIALFLGLASMAFSIGCTIAAHKIDEARDYMEKASPMMEDHRKAKEERAKAQQERAEAKELRDQALNEPERLRKEVEKQKDAVDQERNDIAHEKKKLSSEKASLEDDKVQVKKREADLEEERRKLKVKEGELERKLEEVQKQIDYQKEVRKATEAVERGELAKAKAHLQLGKQRRPTGSVSVTQAFSNSVVFVEARAAGLLDNLDKVESIEGRLKGASEALTRKDAAEAFKQAQEASKGLASDSEKTTESPRLKKTFRELTAETVRVLLESVRLTQDSAEGYKSKGHQKWAELEYALAIHEYKGGIEELKSCRTFLGDMKAMPLKGLEEEVKKKEADIEKEAAALALSIEKCKGQIKLVEGKKSLQGGKKQIIEGHENGSRLLVARSSLRQAIEQLEAAKEYPETNPAPDLKTARSELHKVGAMIRPIDVDLSQGVPSGWSVDRKQEWKASQAGLKWIMPPKAKNEATLSSPVLFIPRDFVMEVGFEMVDEEGRSKPSLWHDCKEKEVLYDPFGLILWAKKEGGTHLEFKLGRDPAILFQNEARLRAVEFNLGKNLANPFQRVGEKELHRLLHRVGGLYLVCQNSKIPLGLSKEINVAGDFCQLSFTIRNPPGGYLVLSKVSVKLHGE